MFSLWSESISLTPIELHNDIKVRLDLINRNMAKEDPKSIAYNFDLGQKIAFKYVKGHIEDMIAMGEQ